MINQWEIQTARERNPKRWHTICPSCFSNIPDVDGFRNYHRWCGSAYRFPTLLAAVNVLLEVMRFSQNNTGLRLGPTFFKGFRFRNRTHDTIEASVLLR